MPVRRGFPYQPYSFLIEKLGDLIIAQDDKGAVRFSGYDASTVIQSAINALTSGGKIFIKAGTYPISATLSLKNNITIEGEGKSSILRLNGNINLFDADWVTGVVIRNLNWDGNKANYPKGADETVLNGIRIHEKTSVTIMNCIIHDFGYRGIVAVGVPNTYPNWILNNEIYNCEDAVYPNNAESWDIIGNYLHDMVDTPLEIGGNANFSRVMFNRIKTTGTGGGGTDHGIEVKGYTHDFIILGNIIQDTIGTAIDIAQASYGVVVGNKIYNSKTHGISVSTGSYDIAVTGNVVVGTSTSQRGIRVTGSSRISVLNNVVVNCPSNGIDITDASSDIIVSGNIAKGNYYGVRVYNSNRVTVTSNYCSNSASDGISPGGTSADLLIENNFCYNNSAYGIDIEAGPTNTVVKHNYLLGNTAGSLRNAGTGSVIKNNIGYVTENGGVATFSGDGSTKTFTIAHGLASTPTKVLVTAGSDAAKGDFYVTADATNITVTYATAPPSGTNNVVLNWYAEV